ncbi:MAG TPA: glutathione S-transferase N-terminal domain-containing protein [Gammaproteobacteria bacterium]|nr:glutathione S-transferase N-terminal domain-containing protein [Gammaproteobacteria bacterium]
MMTLYSEPASALSHRTRIVLAEKDIAVEVLDVDPGNKPEDLLALNPYEIMPTLVDRELTLYDSRVIMEYLDERFPHPPLLPVDPVSRARCRLALYRVEQDWYTLLTDIEDGDEADRQKARKYLRESVLSISPIVEKMPYFMYEEFTIVDCTIAPVLWRLNHYGIELPPQAKAVFKYAERLFARPSFKSSLSDAEKQMRA